MKKRKWLFLLLIIPLISIIIIIKFRYEYIPSSDEIIEEIKATKGYKAKVNYLFINQKSKYSENAVIYYSEDSCNKIQFENGIEEKYIDEDIEIKGEQKLYKIDKELYDTYSLAFVEKIMKNKVLNISEDSEEWGEIEYINIEMLLKGNNENINKANLYIDKKNKVPIMIRVFDRNNKLRIVIKFEEFQYLDNIEKR
ncbi:MAG: hypothetical protein MR274_01625 [Clostridium sp.]|nr:hypothetical protein [Clostridium sp.]MDY3828142.1 germination lipoprotein GerS-related protein [Clostridium sp.]